MEPVVLGEQNHAAATVEENFDENIEKVASVSAENFQKSIYELFNNNGILSDLRAYLRGHIVNVLKSAQNGCIPPINQNFKQRLELANQAMNILVAEYLVCMDFNYSLSVFVSELPLPNMIFDYAQDLLQNSYDENKALRFKEQDILSVLTYLGIKCDRQSISNMLEMYQSDLQASLLLCMVKCLPMYNKKPSGHRAADTIEDNGAIPGESSASEVEVTSPRSTSPVKSKSCRHYHKCKSCQSKFLRLREKSQTRKKDFTKNILNDNTDADRDVESFMKKIDAMEGNLINEMFEELKGVYETEVEVMKNEGEKRSRISLATQEMMLQKKQNEMEEAFSRRAEELDRSVRQKKKFLWSLAGALRDQHGQMRRAMRAVRAEAQALGEKNHMDSHRHRLETSRSVDEKAIEIVQLRQENEKLKRLARQQGEEIEAIKDGATMGNWPIQASLQPNNAMYPQMCVPSFPWSESVPERRELSRTQTTPTPHTRHLISQWRSLRHRVSPASKLSEVSFTPSSSKEGPQRERPKSANANLEEHQSRIENNEFNQPVISYQRISSHSPQRVSTPVPVAGDAVRQREKSPKSLLREAKEKLRSKDDVKTAFLTKNNPREKSPSSVLREAKQRLRKLEIEAEAVEKSYLSFRKRQSEIRDEIKTYEKSSEEAIVTKDVGSNEINKSPSCLRYEANCRSDAINMFNREKANKQDLNQYLINKFGTSFKMNEIFKPQNSATTAKPIPEAFKEDNCRKIENLIDKPLSEFRKLYQIHTNQIRAVEYTPKEKPVPVLALENLNKRMKHLKNDVDVAKNLAINSRATKSQEISEDCNINLEDNSSATENQEISVDCKYFKNVANKHKHPITPSEPEKLSNVKNDIPSVIQHTPKSEKNLLRIEVETISVNNLQESKDQDVFLVVQSAHSQAEKISETESECDQINTNMTIVISPKRSKFQTGERIDYNKVDSPDIFRRSVSPEQQARLTRNEVLDSIFNGDGKDNGEDADSISEVQKDLTAEYEDDFSGDVDYNNSGTDQTPISHRKSSDEDNFWDT